MQYNKLITECYTSNTPSLPNSLPPSPHHPSLPPLLHPSPLPSPPSLPFLLPPFPLTLSADWGGIISWPCDGSSGHGSGHPSHQQTRRHQDLGPAQSQGTYKFNDSWQRLPYLSVQFKTNLILCMHAVVVRPVVGGGGSSGNRLPWS